MVLSPVYRSKLWPIIIIMIVIVIVSLRIVTRIIWSHHYEEKWITKINYRTKLIK